MNVAVALPDATATEAGTVNAAALLDSVTVAPIVFETVTVQVELAPGPRLVGVHWSNETITGATTVSVAVCEVPE